MNMPRIGVVLLFHALVAMAQSPSAFTPTGNLTRPREFHTATLLPNGTVLITGGLDTWNGQTWASAEIYDPQSGSFTATGDMTTARHMHSATLLPSGKVLIAGGNLGDLGPQSSAELYDPASGAFSATGSMTIPRAIHNATLLTNGKVLIGGGQPSVTGAELYDPSTGMFTSTGDMTEAGAGTATLLANGKVLVTRCVDYCYDASKPSHAELYDPASGTFARTGDMIDPHQGAQPTAMLMTNGKVLIAGGSLGDLGESTSAEIYDPSSGAFSATGQMTAGIDAWPAATLLPDGRVLISGESGHGCLSVPGVCIGTTELYDPVTGTFSAPADSQSEEGHAYTLLPDGTVLVTGGWDFCEATPIGIVVPGCGGTLASAEVYHPAVLFPSATLFSLSGDGKGPGAIQHAATYQLVSAQNPAVAGEILVIYATGFVDGSVIPPQVVIGGRLAEVVWFGDTPGYPGLNQINVRVPSGVVAGGAVPVAMNYLNRPSNAVTLAVQ